MFKLAFTIAFLFLLWLQSLFTQTEHVIRGDVHVFRYNGVAWFFLALIALVLVAFAEVARRLLKDRGLALICLLMIPLMGLTSLQLLYERVEVSAELLVRRREPPHTQFNVDLPWKEIQAATKVEHEKPGLFAPSFYNVGYEFILRDGQRQELPSNTVLTHAQEEVDRVLAAHGIPMARRKIPIPP